jgi:hypothetical protein
MVLTILALSALAQVRCVGRTRNIRGSRMTDASFLVPIRRIQVIAVALQLAREAVQTPICSDLLHKRSLSRIPPGWAALLSYRYPAKI